MSNTGTEADPGSVEAVKRVKSTETEWEARIAAARKAADASLAELRAAAAATVATARTEAERERTRAVDIARSTADQEAAQIVAVGQVAADQDAKGSGQRPSDRKRDVIAAVLEDLAGNSGRYRGDPSTGPHDPGGHPGSEGRPRADPHRAP